MSCVQIFRCAVKIDEDKHVDEGRSEFPIRISHDHSSLPSSPLPLRRIVSRPSRHSITSRLKSSASSTPQCEQMSAKGGCKPRLFYLSVLLSSTSPIVKARLKSKNANSKNSKCCDRVLHVTEAENSFNNRPLGTVNCRACGLPLPQGGWIWRLDLQGRENRPQIVRILHANDQTDADVDGCRQFPRSSQPPLALALASLF